MSTLRQIVVLALCLIVMLSLIACGERDPVYTDPSKGVIASSTEPRDIPFSEPPELKREMKTGELIEVDDYVAIKVVSAYRTDKVVPSKPSTFYRTYEAEPGHQYIVIRADVKNLQATTVTADSLMRTSLTVGGMEFIGFAAPETKDGSSFSSTRQAVSPLEEIRIYFLFSVPLDAGGNIEFKAEIQDRIFLMDVDLDQFKVQKEYINIGKTISEPNILSLRLENIYFSNLLEPPNPDRFYHYFESSSGNTFLVLKTIVKNLKSNSLRFDDIAGVSCIYDEKYNYNSFVVFEEDDGKDISNYTNIYALAPLDSCVVYFLMELPEAAKSGVVEVRLFVAGEEYYLKAR